MLQTVSYLDTLWQIPISIILIFTYILASEAYSSSAEGNCVTHGTYLQDDKNA